MTSGSTATGSCAPVQFEFYHDPLANISYRLTYGAPRATTSSIGTGPDVDGVGPALLFNDTKFDTVEAGQPDTASTPAGVFESNFNYDLTSRLTFIQTLESVVSKRDAGQYTHHAVTTLEFEIKRHLNLDVSFIWDYIQNPQPRSDGAIPEKSDYYLTIGFGVRF